MLTLNHKNLDVYKKSVDLVSLLYKVTASYPKEEQFGLTSQLRRASVSVISNIAEGTSRKSAAERRRFYEISRSSLVEVDTQLEISKKLGYLNDPMNDELFNTIEEVFKMLSSLIKNTK